MSTKYGVKEVCDITFYDLVTNQPILFLDTLKMTSIENKATTSYARGGKGNPKLLAWDFDREATVKMQDALMSTKSLSMLVGQALSKGVTNVYKRELLTAVAGTTGKSKVTPAKDPLAGSLKVFLVSDSLTTPIASATFTTPDITFDSTDVIVGAQVEVFYMYATSNTAEKITISSDHFPAYVKVVGDTVVRNNTTGQDEAFQIVIHKAKINPTFTMDLKSDGDPSVFEMDLDVFRRDIDTEMIEMIKY